MKALYLVQACAGRPVAVSMALLATVLAGALSLSRMPLERLPPLAVPRIVVEAALPGYSATEVRSLVACPLEDALASAKGLRRVSSVSRDGRAVLTLDFSWGEPPGRAAAQARELADAVFPSLPLGAARPVVHAYDPAVEPLLVLALWPLDGDMATARRLADLECRARLRRIAGIGRVVLVGGAEREIAVAVDEPRAASLGLSVADIAGAVSRESLDAAAGCLREGDRELSVIARGSASSVEELAGLALATPSGAVRLGDLAEVTQRESARRSLFVSDGRECVGLELYRREGAAPVAASRAARAEIAALERDFGSFMGFRLAADASTSVLAAVGALATAGLLGAAAATLALLWLFREPRSGLLVTLTIPLSVLATASCLYASGRSLNVMSLGGMGLAVGMVSDAAVLCLDAMSSRLGASTRRPSPAEIAEAVSTVLPGLSGSLATTVVVFVPVMALPGAVGALFGDIARAIIAANVIAWLLAAFALPAMYRLLWRRSLGCRPGESRRDGWGRAYGRSLAWAFERPVACLAGAALAAACGSAVTLSRPASLMPADEAEELVLRAAFAPGTDPDGMAHKAVELGRELSAVPGVSAAFGRAGAESEDVSATADPAFAMEALRFRCALVPGSEVEATASLVLAAARRVLPPDIGLELSRPPDPAALALGLGEAGLLAVTAGTQAEASSRADELAASIGERCGQALRTIERRPSGRRPLLLMDVDRPALVARGVSLAEAAATVRASTEGLELSDLEVAGRRLPVRLFARGIDGPEDLASLSLDGAEQGAARGAARGASVGGIARFVRRLDEPEAFRLDRADAFYLRPVPVPGRERELGRAVDGCLRGSTGVVRTGASQATLYARSLGSALALVLALLYLTLGMQFESLSLPLYVMLTIPLAMAGVGPAVALFGLDLDSGVAIGLVVLFGVSVNGAILLEEAIAARRSAGLGPVEAALAGAADRARPVAATALTTILALAPVCLFPAGAAQRSMSATLLGGVAAGTLLTLFVTPLACARRRSGSRP